MRTITDFPPQLLSLLKPVYFIIAYFLCSFHPLTAQDDLPLLAHFPLTADAKDKTGQVREASLINAPIREQGVFLGGNYGSYDANDKTGNLLSVYIPNLGLENFSLSVSFKTEASVSKPAGMNILSIGRACRYINLYLNDKNQLGVQLNNGKVRKYSSKTISPNTWQTVWLTYDSKIGKVQVFQKGQLLVELIHEMTFELCGMAKDISTTDFSNGNSFRGYMRDLRVFYKGLHAYEQIDIPIKDEKDDTDKDDGNHHDHVDNNDTDDTDKNDTDDIDTDDTDDTDKDDDHDKEVNPIVTNGIRQEVTELKLDVAPFAYAQIAPRPDGYSYLAWNENVKQTLNTFGKLHITTLDPNFKKVGQDIVLDDYEIRQILAIDNDYMYLIVGERKNNTFTGWYKYDYLEANILYFLKLDKHGKVLTKTTLFGDKGQGPGAIWADNGFGIRYETKLMYNGEHFALYTGIRRNFAKKQGEDDVHEGDLFMLIDRNGKVLTDKTQRWYSSHAFYMKMAVNQQGEFLTTNLGDAYPVGIVVRNRNTKKMNNVWPPKKVEYKNGQTWYFAAGRVGEMLEKNGKIYLLHGASRNGESKRDDKLDVTLLRINRTMEVEKTTWLTNSPNKNERYIYGGWLGNSILMAYSVYENYKVVGTQLMLIDTEGKKMKTAIPAQSILNYTSSHFVPFPDQSLVIMTVDRTLKSIKILKVIAEN